MNHCDISQWTFLHQGLGTPYFPRYRKCVCCNNTQLGLGVLSQYVVVTEKSWNKIMDQKILVVRNIIINGYFLNLISITGMV